MRETKKAKVTCPQCKAEYWTDLECEGELIEGQGWTRVHAIQNEHPDATPIQREQWLSGLCSDECWDAYLGGQ